MVIIQSPRLLHMKKKSIEHKYNGKGNKIKKIRKSLKFLQDDSEQFWGGPRPATARKSAGKNVTLRLVLATPFLALQSLRGGVPWDHVSKLLLQLLQKRFAYKFQPNTIKTRRERPRRPPESAAPSSSRRPPCIAMAGLAPAARVGSGERSEPGEARTGELAARSFDLSGDALEAALPELVKLARAGDEGAFDAIRRGLADRGNQARERSVLAAGAVGDRSVIAQLAPLVRDPDSDVREGLVKAVWAGFSKMKSLPRRACRKHAIARMTASNVLNVSRRSGRETPCKETKIIVVEQHGDT